MQLPEKYWTGLIWLLLVYTAVQLLYFNPPVKLPYWVQTFKQPIRWFSITIVFITGIFILRRVKDQWLLILWNLIHFVVIGYLLAVAFYEYIIAPVSYGIRASVEPIVEFLVSPIIYIGMGIMYASIQKKQPTKNEKDF